MADAIAHPRWICSLMQRWKWRHWETVGLAKVFFGINLAQLNLAGRGGAGLSRAWPAWRDENSGGLGSRSGSGAVIERAGPVSSQCVMHGAPGTVSKRLFALRMSALWWGSRFLRGPALQFWVLPQGGMLVLAFSPHLPCLQKNTFTHCLVATGMTDSRCRIPLALKGLVLAYWTFCATNTKFPVFLCAHLGFHGKGAACPGLSLQCSPHTMARAWATGGLECSCSWVHAVHIAHTWPGDWGPRWGERGQGECRTCIPEGLKGTAALLGGALKR